MVFRIPNFDLHKNWYPNKLKMNMLEITKLTFRKDVVTEIFCEL